MPTEILEMTVVSSPDQWTLTDSDKVTAVNSPDDDTTSFIFNATATQIERYTVANPSTIGANDTINFVRSSFRCISVSGTDTVRANQELSGSKNTGTTRDPGGSYTTYTEDFNDKPGGSGWTLTDVNNLEFEVESVNIGALGANQVTTMQLIVDFTPVDIDFHTESRGEARGENRGEN